MNLKESSTSVALDKVSAHFSASHALISDDYEEGFHGHNYQVEVEVEGEIDENNMIIDFVFLENLICRIVSSWDHYVLLPSNNRYIEFKENNHNMEIMYGDRYYSIPKTEIKMLDCTNVTTEALARLLGGKIRDHLKKEVFWKRIEAIKVTIWETSRYRASYTIKTNFSEY
ncbi:MAG: 6-pyruvoyl tetrahydropterin synthase family protein [Promethearchaeota archaeon]